MTRNIEIWSDGGLTIIDLKRLVIHFVNHWCFEAAAAAVHLFSNCTIVKRQRIASSSSSWLIIISSIMQPKVWMPTLSWWIWVFRQKRWITILPDVRMIWYVLYMLIESIHFSRTCLLPICSPICRLSKKKRHSVNDISSNVTDWSVYVFGLFKHILLIFILQTFTDLTQYDQVDFVKSLLQQMCHYQHGQINTFLKPMLQRDFISLLPGEESSICAIW